MAIGATVGAACAIIALVSIAIPPVAISISAIFGYGLAAAAAVVGLIVGIYLAIIAIVVFFAIFALVIAAASIAILAILDYITDKT